MAKIYTLSGYPEEAIAHAFAKTSRSADSFTDMIKDLTQDKTNKFHSKWVIKYGHNSIAEHAVIHLAIEDISRIAMAALESGRLASYTEQSTRYLSKTAEDIFIDPAWNAEFVSDYKLVCEKLFSVYDRINSLEKKYGEELGFCGYDFSRFVLPLGVKVNAGITINSRSLRRTLCKMLASDLPEVSALAQQIKDTAIEVAPTLLRHVRPCVSTEILNKLGKNLNLTKPHICDEEKSPISVVCQKFDIDIKTIVQGLAYEYSDLSWGEERWARSPLKDLLNSLSEHDVVPRVFEEGFASFEVVSDYGSFYDMKRHRMASLYVQQKSLGKLGYIVPGHLALKEMGVLQEYIEAMETVNMYAMKWMHLPEHVYLFPNAYRIRYKISMNPRELIEIIKIRGLNKGGHTSYRYIGLKMLEIAQQNSPELFQWLNKWLSEDDSPQNMIKGYKLFEN